MQILENSRLRAVIENGWLVGLYDKAEATPANLADPEGHTGGALYTLQSDDITALPCDRYAPYAERRSWEEGAVATRTDYALTDLGLQIELSTEDPSVSAFGLLLDLEFLDKLHEDIGAQLLPTSPYTSEDGRFLFCLYTRPCGRFLVACVTTQDASGALIPAAGWKNHYSSYECGHYILDMEFLASFDRHYGEQSPKRIQVTLQPAEDLADAYRAVGAIYGVPYLIPVQSGGFDGRGVVRLSEGTDRVVCVAPDGSETTLPVTSRTLAVELPDFGFYRLIPYAGTVQGVDCRLWNGADLLADYGAVCRTVAKPYHPDYNLCEGGCWIWSLLRYMQLTDSHAFDEPVLEDLRVITAQTQPYVVRRTIAPSQEGYAPYHIFGSYRVQEQFFGVSVLLDAYKRYGDPLYLDFAQKAADELIDNWMTPDGGLTNGRVDYTTVGCPVIPMTDLALFLRERDPAAAARYENAALRMADHVFRRGFDFPTEGSRSKKSQQMEDGSISCTALSLLYVCRHLRFDPAYLQLAADILRFHSAWEIYSPDARMFGSSFRWWETIWEGNADGPGICAGHAWTIWRSEALFLQGLLQKDAEALLDSWNGFVTNYCKMDRDGNLYSCYLPDYLCGGGETAVREEQMGIPAHMVEKPYKITHGYPELTDRSLSRYAWVRTHDTWLTHAAVLEVEGQPIFLRCRLEDGVLQFDGCVETLILDCGMELSGKLCREVEILDLRE